MSCQLTWGVCRNPAPSATVFCITCMAPVEYGINLMQAKLRRDELIEQHLCRREHALPIGPRPRRLNTPSQGSLFL